MHSPRSLPRHCEVCGTRYRHSAVKCFTCRPADLTTFAGRLRAAWLRTELTQSDLSRRVGMDPGYLSSMLSGKRNPTIFIVQCTAQALGVSPGWLAFGEGDME